jgi:hypothetical protein
MNVIKLNSTGVEWVLYDSDREIYWRGGQQWTSNEAFALSFISPFVARRHCEATLQISPDFESDEVVSMWTHRLKTVRRVRALTGERI